MPYLESEILNFESKTHIAAEYPGRLNSKPDNSLNFKKSSISLQPGFKRACFFSEKLEKNDGPNSRLFNPVA